MVGCSTDPEFYKKTRAENFNLNDDLEDIFKSYDNLVPPAAAALIKPFLLTILDITTAKQLEKATLAHRRKVKQIFKKSQYLYCLRELQRQGKVQKGIALEKLLVKKGGKSHSGVLVITVLTSPYPQVDGKVQKFSCEWNCYYCPNEPGQPRSYLHDEPSVLRANRNRFDPVLQFNDRALALLNNGHPVDKIELLVLGGTWASYPLDYREHFIRDLFFAANTFLQRYENIREKFSLEKEKKLNEIADCKIIGITLETRPDCINPMEIKLFRKYGCTRVQLGIQHTDDRILKKINRGCTNNDTMNALKLLKDSCFKIDIHLMPNLPGSNASLDRIMFNDVLNNPMLQADQWKIYPCETLPWTVIQKWFESGEYVPYAEEELMELLLDVKPRVHPWIRLNRVIRDIPSQYILGGVDRPSMRQDVLSVLKSQGKRCRCIRCREIKNIKNLSGEAVLMVRKYDAQDGLEYFVSFETSDERYIFGFARLRIPGNKKNKKINDKKGSQEIEVEDEQEERTQKRSHSTTRRRARSKSPFVREKKTRRRTKQGQNRADAEYEQPFQELKNAALVRELHVYGQLIPTNKSKKSHSQHLGFGKRLMAKCEELALEHNGITKIAVISGVGVRNFYRKIGYQLEGEGEMMTKSLYRYKYVTSFLVVALITSVIAQLALVFTFILK